jgi:hypothetical protein
MKITRSKLKQLIREELSTARGRQSAEDIERTAVATANANWRAALDAKKARFKQDYPTAEQQAGTIVEMLTKLTDMVEQLLQKP